MADDTIEIGEIVFETSFDDLNDFSVELNGHRNLLHWVVDKLSGGSNNAGTYSVKVTWNKTELEYRVIDNENVSQQASQILRWNDLDKVETTNSFIFIAGNGRGFFVPQNAAGNLKDAIIKYRKDCND